MRLSEFAADDGDSGRWYTDDQMTDLVGDGWWQDMDVSGANIGVPDSEVPKAYMIQQAQRWLKRQGHDVQVLNVKLNDDDMEWYIEGAFPKDLTEFAPGDSGDSGEDILHKYARMWWNGDDATQQKIEAALARMGWEIGEDEGGYNNGGVFVVRAGDEHGRSYISWSAEDLTEGLTEVDRRGFLKGLGAAAVAGAAGGAKAQNDTQILDDMMNLYFISKKQPGWLGKDQDRVELLVKKYLKIHPDKKSQLSSIYANISKKAENPDLEPQYKNDPNIKNIYKYDLNGIWYNYGVRRRQIIDNFEGLMVFDEGSEDPFGPQGRFVGDTGPAQITATVRRVTLRTGDRVIYKPTEQRATIEALSRDGTKARIHVPSPMGGRTFNCEVADLKAIGRGSLEEKSTSQAQFRTMAAAAHDPAFARKVGIKQSVAKEFNKADKGQSYKSLPKRAD